MGALELAGVAKTLGAGGAGERSAVLRDVSFRVPAGQCLGLRGVTGSGKTTLLRLIAGLEAVDGGAVKMDGLVVSSTQVHVPPGRRRVGFVFQSLGLWPHLSVDGHLDYVLDASPFRGDERARRRAELLDLFHLRGLERRRPGELSGGERHLLAIARALCGEVRFLVLDEPFAGLDGQLRELVVSALDRVRRQRGLTALLASHDPRDFRALCDSVLRLREGRVAEAASSEKLTAESAVVL